MTAVLELMPDLSSLVSKLRDLSVVDELTRGLVYQVHERRETTPLWLAFGVQVYLDILHSFGQTCDGLGTMQAESRRIKQSLLDVPVADRCDVLRAAGLWDDDPIWVARKLAVTAGMLPRVRSPPIKFLRRNLIHPLAPTARTQGQNGRSRGPVCDTVAEAIMHEKPGLCFNFFTMRNEAWLFLERLNTALNERLGNAGRLPRGRGGPVARPRTEGAGERRTPACCGRRDADVVDVGHGKRMRDVAVRDVKPREVQALKQGLTLWALDKKGP
ncbi:hypothetical protein LEL_09964 [Akanthomyces lecanii RCEF 1005]|uniref:Uncharacterized protein n=1 Tax=Akanthomyces lecanii RCEF 1005 TaxID=1081108 RepID=A0A168BI55_CORDF|nr:hypothetical protein LEL_09964 [Akanthomyces lecanii RCEF 1005]